MPLKGEEKKKENRLQLKFSMLKKDCYNQLCVMMTDYLGPLSDCGCCRLPRQRRPPVGRTANPEISAEVWRHPKLCSTPFAKPAPVCCPQQRQNLLKR